MARVTLVYRPGHPLASEFGMVEKHLAGPRHTSDAAPYVIPDLKDYRAAATDVATGNRPVISGRRAHREFLRRNNYQEVGNDYVKPQHETLTRSDRIADIRRALGE